MSLALYRIRSAPDEIRGGGRPDLRAETYLRTYPSLLDLGQKNPVDETVFHQLACATYGWMPRVGRLNPAHIEHGIEALEAARIATRDDWHEVEVTKLVKCLHSVVGASKMLHFVNPCVFPIWDSKIEGFRQNNGPFHHNHMNNVEHYRQYACNVWDVVCESGFDEFLSDMQDALERCLDICQIPSYDISKIRAVELGAFALSQ